MPDWMIENPYHWTARLQDGSEMTASSPGWNISVTQAAARSGVIAMSFAAIGLPTIIFRILPDRRVIFRRRFQRMPVFTDNQFVAGYGSIFGHVAIGFVEGGRAVEARIREDGIVELSAYYEVCGVDANPQT